MMEWVKAFAGGVLILLLVGGGVLTHDLLSQNDLMYRQNEELYRERAFINFSPGSRLGFYGPHDKIDDGSRVVNVHRGDKVAIVVDDACQVTISNMVMYGDWSRTWSSHIWDESSLPECKDLPVMPR